MAADPSEESLDCVQADDPDNRQLVRADLMLQSVGTATPRAAAVIAEALALPREFVVDAIYRAPARLLADLPAADARRLACMLDQLGLQTEVVRAGTAPARGAVYDLAVVMNDPLRTPEVAQALGRFLGMSAQSALDLVLTPPGIVLGNVTQPTVDALASVVPDGAATLIASNPDVARYALFAAELPPTHRAAIQPLLPHSQVAGASGGPLSCFDLAKSDADTLWRRLCALDGVRIVNQDFLRFTIVLTGVPDNPRVGSKGLMDLAGMPESLYDELVGALPCPVVDGIPYANLQASLAAFIEAGFTVQADLETFVMMALDIRCGPPGALDAVGLTGVMPLVTAPMPREQARALRARLEALGAEVLPV